MELTQILAWLAAKSPEFIVGFMIGLMIALAIAYIYLLPRFVKNATAGLTEQVKLLIAQVNTQSGHIAHLELQVGRLEKELGPYRLFAEQQLARLLVTDSADSPDR